MQIQNHPRKKNIDVKKENVIKNSLNDGDLLEPLDNGDGIGCK